MVRARTAQTRRRLARPASVVDVGIGVSLLPFAVCPAAPTGPDTIRTCAGLAQCQPADSCRRPDRWPGDAACLAGAARTTARRRGGPTDGPPGAGPLAHHAGRPR